MIIDWQAAKKYNETQIFELQKIKTTLLEANNWEELNEVQTNDVLRSTEINAPALEQKVNELNQLYIDTVNLIHAKRIDAISLIDEKIKGLSSTLENIEYEIKREKEKK